MSLPRRWAGLRADGSQEGGYVAIVTALLLVVLMGLAAFAVDVGRWYVVGQQEQRAADAAALAGVTSLPTNTAGAFSAAQDFSKVNGFQNGTAATTVTPVVDGRPTRLRVTVSRTVNNIFGPLMGNPTTTVTRTAVADFGGPVPMGSPCNEFGNDPEPGSNRGAACSGVSGQMWANVNSPSSDKGNGDAYQSVNGCSSSVDGCTSGTNTDYSTDGYFYTISVKSSMPSLTIELFDPVYVNVGLTCSSNFGTSGGGDLSTSALNDVVTDESTRYKSLAVGPTGDLPRPYCTGDASYSGSQVMNTQFTVRDPSPNLWNPATFPVHAGCQKTYPGYSGSLFDVLDQHTTGTTPRSTYNKDSTGTTTSPTIVDGFRRWTTLCTIPNPVVGDYVVQVKTNFPAGDARNNANAGNRFSMRAYGSGSGDKDFLSVSGREKMGIYSNLPGATTEFHFARVPSGAAGQTLRLRLFDVGDSTTSGTIQIVSPPDAAGGSFTGCRSTLSTAAPVTLATCSFTVSNSTHQAKWQTVLVPIPTAYSCNDLDPTKCWVRLRYLYGSGSVPTDVTTWAAGVDGDPVRLVE
jgi:Flp pilus assembly protein TadG